MSEQYKPPNFFDKVPFLGRNGMTIVETRPGYSKTKLELKNNTNHFGVMYAGAIYCIAESSAGNLFGACFNPQKYYVLIYKQEIRYIAPGKTDLYFEIQMSQDEIYKIQQEMDVKGKSNFQIKGEVVDENGKIIAKSIGYYQGRLITAKL